jgi:pimeloyl-ACP methyl ester carboxylesterase
MLAEDAAACLDSLGISRAVVAGSSMASLVVVELAAMRPDLIDGLILVGGFATLGAAGKEVFEQRAVLAETQGMEPLAELVPVRAFGAYSHAAQPGLVGLFRQAILSNDPAAYAASCRAIRDADVTPSLGRVSCPTLILLGEEEQVAPLTAARVLKSGIPHAQVRVLPGAGHLPFLEQPAAFNAAILEFIGGYTISRDSRP